MHINRSSSVKSVGNIQGLTNTDKGLFQHKRLPFGITSPSVLAILQWTMESLLQGHQHIDDIVVITGTSSQPEGGLTLF